MPRRSEAFHISPKQVNFPASAIRRFNEATAALKDSGLTPKQQELVEAQLFTLSGTETAARKIGLNKTELRARIRKVYENPSLRHIGKDIIDAVRTKEKPQEY